MSHTYKVSTRPFSSRDVQFNGHATCIWYSHVPFDAFQNPTLGRTVEGKAVMSGVKVQLPMADITNDFNVDVRWSAVILV